jgi:hypothetical protein
MRRSQEEDVTLAFPQKRPKNWGWYHLPLPDRPTFSMLLKELNEAEWEESSDDYQVIHVYDLPIHAQRELYPFAKFEGAGYRYQLVRAWMFRVRLEIAEDDRVVFQV